MVVPVQNRLLERADRPADLRGDPRRGRVERCFSTAPPASTTSRATSRPSHRMGRHVGVHDQPAGDRRPAVRHGGLSPASSVRWPAGLPRISASSASGTASVVGDQPVRDPQDDLQVYVVAVRGGHDVGAATRRGRAPRHARKRDRERGPAGWRQSGHAARGRPTDDLQLRRAGELSEYERASSVNRRSRRRSATAWCAAPVAGTFTIRRRGSTPRRRVASRSARTTRAPGRAHRRSPSGDSAWRWSLAAIPLAVAAGVLIGRPERWDGQQAAGGAPRPEADGGERRRRRLDGWRRRRDHRDGFDLLCDARGARDEQLRPGAGVRGRARDAPGRGTTRRRWPRRSVTPGHAGRRRWA